MPALRRRRCAGFVLRCGALGPACDTGRSRRERFADYGRL